MKLKNIIAIAAFTCTFTFSAFLFGSESKTVQTKYEFSFTPEQSQMQKNIRHFLAEDQKNGRNYYAEVARTEGDNRLINEAPATAKLVLKMQRQNCSGLPTDFCAAWSDHLNAWENLAKLENRAVKTSDESDEIMEDYADKNFEINRTYEFLIETARQRGVNFSY